MKTIWFASFYIVCVHTRVHASCNRMYFGIFTKFVYSDILFQDCRDNYDLTIYFFQTEKFLVEKLDTYESAVGDVNVKGVARIEVFPPAFQAIPRNPIVLDLAYNFIEFPSLENRMKKDKKGFISRLWRWDVFFSCGFLVTLVMLF